MSATFKVTSGREAFNGDLVANASWTNQTSGAKQSETAAEKVRNVSPVKINEFRMSSGSPANLTDSFIELYNAGASDADISNWTLTEHTAQQAIFSTIKIPAGTKLAAGGFYLLGLSNSGLAVSARAGDTTLYVRSTAGMTAGDTIGIDTGSSVETRKSIKRFEQTDNDGTMDNPPQRYGDYDSIDWTQCTCYMAKRSLLVTAPPIPPSQRHREVRGGHGHRGRQTGHASLPRGGRTRRFDQHQGDVGRRHLGR